MSTYLYPLSQVIDFKVSARVGSGSTRKLGLVCGTPHLSQTLPEWSGSALTDLFSQCLTSFAADTSSPAQSWPAFSQTVLVFSHRHGIIKAKVLLGLCPG
jgi:hypothetical protein